MPRRINALRKVPFQPRPKATLSPICTTRKLMKGAQSTHFAE